MSITAYARELENLAKLFAEHKITYAKYIAECNRLGEMELE